MLNFETWSLSRSRVRICQLLSGPGQVNRSSTTTTTIETTATTVFNPNQTLLYTDSFLDYYRVKVEPGTKMYTGTSNLTCAKYGMKAVCGHIRACYNSMVYVPPCAFTPLRYVKNRIFPIGSNIIN